MHTSPLQIKRPIAVHELCSRFFEVQGIDHHAEQFVMSRPREGLVESDIQFRAPPQVAAGGVEIPEDGFQQLALRPVVGRRPV